MKSFLLKCLLLVNVLTLIPLLMAFSAQFISSEQWWLPSVLALGYPAWFFLPLFWMLVWIRLVRKNMWLNLLFLLIHYQHLLNTFQVSTSHRSAPNDIKVYSLNVASFGYDPDQVQVIAKDIAKLNPDVVCLQEFRTPMHFKGKRVNTLTHFKKMLGLRFHALVPYSNESGYGLVVLSRYPIKDSDRIGNESLTPANGMMFADLEMYGKKLRVFNLHLQSYKFNAVQRQLFKSQPVANAIGRKRKDGKKPATFLKNYWKMTKEMLRTWKIHQLQTQSLAYHKDTVSYATITCGDLNNTPYQAIYRLVKGNQRDAYQEKGNGTGTTYGSGLAQVRIDYIFAGKELKVVNFKTLKSHSDHRANYARLRFLTGKKSPATPTNVTTD